MSIAECWSGMHLLRFAVAPLAAGLLLGFCAGCGSSSRPTDSPSSAANAEANDEAADGSAPASKPGKKSKGSASSSKKSSRGKSKDSRGTTGPHIGEIPRDAWPEVFFDEPLSVYAERGSAPAVASGAAPDARSTGDAPPERMTESPAEPGGTKSPAASGGSDWPSLLTGEVLADETKAVKSSLTDKLQSVGKYSGNYKELRVDAATLAIFASIANEFPDAPSWKANAKYIRDASAEIVRSASANGDKYYKPTRAAFDRLDTLMAGSKPPGLEEVSDSLPFSEVVSRTPLMFRMERAFNYLKLSVNTEAAFKKEAAKVTHEASVLAALAKAVAAPTYEDADLDEYQGYARELQQCGTGVTEAVRNGDYAAYTAALDRGSKACTDCHSQFKNN